MYFLSSRRRQEEPFFPFCILRNTNKNEALDAKNFVVFFLKVVCDATSKLILFGTWMLTYSWIYKCPYSFFIYKCWNLSTNLIVAFYYGMVSVLLITNFGFCLIEKDEIVSLRNMIGNKSKVFHYICPTHHFFLFRNCAK